MVGGSYLGRKELDPFGADVTEPPQPTLIPEPVFYNPKFADMPLQIEGGPSAEYEQANADWASLVTATIRTAQERDRAEKLWQSGKRSEAMALLQKNPNLGIEYRALVGGEVVSSGSYFGQAAADFLNGINIAVGAGLLSPVVGTGVSTEQRHHPLLQGPGAKESAMAIAQKKNCATPNSIVEQYNLEFEAQWNRTLRTGEENASLVFYEQSANNYFRLSLSEGRHLYDGITTGPALPEVDAKRVGRLTILGERDGAYTC